MEFTTSVRVVDCNLNNQLSAAVVVEGLGQTYNTHTALLQCCVNEWYPPY